MMQSENGVPPVAYWEPNQVVVTFQSGKGLTAARGDIITSLNLANLNKLLTMNGFSLTSLTAEDVPQPSVSAQPQPPVESPPPDEKESAGEEGIEGVAKNLLAEGKELFGKVVDNLTKRSGNTASTGDAGLNGIQRDFNSDIGKYLFKGPGGEGTSVVSIFRIEPVPGVPTMATSAMHMATTENGWGDGKQKMGGMGMYYQNDATASVVNLINRNLTHLKKVGVPALSATPNWLNGGTPIGCTTHGCPVSPPVPIEDTCEGGAWKLALPELPEELQRASGKGVTVLVLDTLPKKEQVTVAATTTSGQNNPLLQDINNHVRFDYRDLPDREDVPNPMLPGTGKDIYGRLVGFPMTDHGVFIAGMIHDLAPDATVECIRVLNDFGVGNTTVLADAFSRIQRRLLGTQTPEDGPKLQIPLVINLSLVATPPDEELNMPGSPFDKSSIYQFRDGLQVPMRSLADMGVIFVASAGNDSDPRPDASMSMSPFMGNTTPQATMTMSSADAPATSMSPAASPSAATMAMPPKRIGPRYPAAFAYDNAMPGIPSIPHIAGVIPVGAINGQGDAASYSNYPGPDGIATYGGELFNPDPVDAPSVSVLPLPLGTRTKVVLPIDGVRGVYTAPLYPSPSRDDNLFAPPSPPPPDYPEFQPQEPNTWAYWAGTSFATPIVSALAARVLENQHASGGIIGGDSVRDAIKAAATQTPLWTRVDDTSTTPLPGYVVAATQTCTSATVTVE